MPQIAQQDYIYVEIADFANVSDAEKAELRKYMAAGNLFDVILIDGNYRCKIIGYNSQTGSESIFYYDMGEESINVISIAE